MSYSAVETAICDLLTTVEGFSFANVAQGHYRNILSQQYSITLTPGAVSRQESGLQSVRVKWGVRLELFSRISEPIDADSIDYARDGLLELFDRVSGLLDTYPTLGGGAASPDANPYVISESITRSLITSAGSPERQLVGRINLWSMAATCQVTELIITTMNLSDIPARERIGFSLVADELNIRYHPEQTNGE